MNPRPEEVLAVIETYLLSAYPSDQYVVVRVPEGVLLLVTGGPHVLVRANVASLVVA